MDKFTPKERSKIMRQVKGKDTAPERQVRSLLHRMGLRFRLHQKNLPGVPDIVLPKYKSVIFVHGCFWHRHPGCKRASMPTSNVDYWEDKFSKNLKRDAECQAQLTSLGWRVIIIWECELKALVVLQEKLFEALHIMDGV